MTTRALGAGLLAVSLTAGFAATPALARPDAGAAHLAQESVGTDQTKTVLRFTKSMKRKLRRDGIKITSVYPARERKHVKIALPAEATAEAIEHEGGVELTLGDQSLSLTDFAFDLTGKTVVATVGGSQEPIEDLLTLRRVRVTKNHAVKTRVRVGKGTAELLNGTLGSKVFKDGMLLAKTRTK